MFWRDNVTYDSASGSLVVGGENFALKPSLSGIRVIIAGDSRTQYNVEQTGANITNRARWWNWLNALLGQRFELVNNAGVAGDTASGLWNRIKTSNLGGGFGANTSPYVQSSPGANIPCEIVIVNIGYNDLLGNGSTAAATFVYTKQICDYIRASGKMLILCTVAPPNSAASGYSTARCAELVKYNRLLREYAQSNSGVYLADFFAAMVSPVSTVVEALATDMIDGTVHENNRGGYKEAKVLQALLQSITAPRQGLLPTCNAATSALDATIKQLEVNGLLNGSVAISVSGYSGNAAGSNLANANFVRGGSPTVVLSAVARTDEYGQNTKAVITFTAAGESIEHRRPSYHAQAEAGAEYYAVCEVSYTGSGGAALQASDNLRGIQLSLQYNDGTTNTFTYDMMPKTLDLSLSGSETLVLRTPKLKIPSGGTPTTLRANLAVVANGAGTVEVIFGRFALYKV